MRSPSKMGERRRYSELNPLTEEKEVEFTVYVREEGRMTVPKGVRDALGIREGDLVKCTIGKVKARQARKTRKAEK